MSVGAGVPSGAKRRSHRGNFVKEFFGWWAWDPGWNTLSYRWQSQKVSSWFVEALFAVSKSKLFEAQHIDAGIEFARTGSGTPTCSIPRTDV